MAAVIVVSANIPPESYRDDSIKVEPHVLSIELYRLDSLVVNSIDEVLMGVFSDQVRDAVYKKLEMTCLTRSNQIAEHLDDLSEILDETFGRASKVIQRRIAKRIIRKIGWEFVEIPEFGLLEYFEMVKSRFTKDLQSSLMPRVGSSPLVARQSNGRSTFGLVG